MNISSPYITREFLLDRNPTITNAYGFIAAAVAGSAVEMDSYTVPANRSAILVCASIRIHALGGAAASTDTVAMYLSITPNGGAETIFWNIVRWDATNGEDIEDIKDFEVFLSSGDEVKLYYINDMGGGSNCGFQGSAVFIEFDA